MCKESNPLVMHLHKHTLQQHIYVYRRRQYYNVLNKILCILTVTAISVLLSSSATSRTRHIGIEYMYKKGGQVTKPIIVVEIPCKLLYQKCKLLFFYIPLARCESH